MTAAQVADAFVAIFEEGLRPRAPARRGNAVRANQRPAAVAERATARSGTRRPQQAHISQTTSSTRDKP
jgi:hypothetical protein